MSEEAPRADDQKAPDEDSPESPADPRLDALEARIRELKRPAPRDMALAHGLSLVFSLGAVVAMVLFVGYLAAAWLHRQGYPEILSVLALLASMGAAGLSAYKLLLPFLKT